MYQGPILVFFFFGLSKCYWSPPHVHETIRKLTPHSTFLTLTSHPMSMTSFLYSRFALNGQLHVYYFVPPSLARIFQNTLPTTITTITFACRMFKDKWTR